MIFLFRAFLMGLAAAAVASAAERDVVKKFPVRAGSALEVDAYRGQIVVEESDSPEITIAVHLETATDAEPAATRIFDAVQLDFSAVENSVKLRARNPRETRVLWYWEENKVVDLACKITVPRACHLNLRVGSGSITVGNIAGRHVARAEAGTIFFKRIDGSVDVRADSGLVIVSRCSGAVTARMRQGTIRLGTISGRVDAKNDSGDIDVLQAKAGIVAVAEAGDVAVGFPVELGAENRVRTSGGSVTAKIDAKAKCAIEAAAVFGRVESKLPLTIDSGGLGQRKLTARLNGGGPAIALHASGGDVKIVPMDFEID